MIPQTLNNEVLSETVSLKNLFVRTVSAKNEKRNVTSDFNYSHRLLHTYACFKLGLGLGLKLGCDKIVKVH